MGLEDILEAVGYVAQSSRGRSWLEREKLDFMIIKLVAEKSEYEPNNPRRMRGKRREVG